MLRSVALAFASGAVGGVANVVYLVLASNLGLAALFGLQLPSFLEASFLYKQMVWGGFWAILFLLPIAPKPWLQRGLVFGLAASAGTLFVFFPLGSTETGGPGLAGLRIGPLMPVFVVLANLVWGLAASKVYDLLRR